MENRHTRLLPVALGLVVQLLTAVSSARGEVLDTRFNDGNGITYHVLSANTWSASRAEAESLGGTLATIRDQYEQSWIFSQFSGYGDLWIGFTDEASEGTFEWLSGEPVTYTNWGHGEPNGGTSENWVHLGTSRTWNDNSDDKLYCAVVEVMGKPGGDVLRVPEDYPTIQAAIDASIPGDTVLVSPGTYLESINFGSRCISVISEFGPDRTTIDAGRSGRVVTIDGGQTPEAVLDGFTLRNGVASLGGGIYIADASPTVTRCWIHDNESTSWLDSGGGMYLVRSSAQVRNNEIFANTARDWGGGILVNEGGSPLIQGNLIRDNQSFQAGGIFCADRSSPVVRGNVLRDNYAERGGGGIFCNWESTAIIDGNLLEANQADERGGGLVLYTQVCEVINNVIVGNTAPAGSAVWCGVRDPVLVHNTMFANVGSGVAVHAAEGAAPSLFNCIAWGNVPDQIAPGLQVEYCLVQGGFPGVGNIDADPRFRDESALDLHLAAGSPCIDAAGSSPPYLAPTDFDGEPRVIGPTPDIGADEVGLVITGVTPTRSRYDAEVDCTITGIGFTVYPPQEVLFGDLAASQVVVVSDTEVQCVAPAAPQGAVEVALVNPEVQATASEPFTFTPAIVLAGDWRPGGSLDVSYLLDPGDSLFGIYGFDPEVSLETPGYDGVLCILPFWRAFLVWSWPTDTWSQSFSLPDDPAISGLEFLMQGLVGPSFGSPKDAAWTNCARVIIQ